MSDRLDRLIDRADTYCLNHAWVPSWLRVWVGGRWEKMVQRQNGIPHD